MTEVLSCTSIFGLRELSQEETFEVSAGGVIFGIATGLLAVATIALTVACPPVALVGLVVAGEVIVGIGSTVAAFMA